jgi:hypothetical protein
MLIAGQLLKYLILIHLFWFYCLVTGSLVRTSVSPSSSRDEARHNMADLVITSTTGMAITGFVLLALGFIGLLNIAGLLAWLVIEALLFRAVKHENILRLGFWTGRLQIIRQAWSLPALLIYLVFLFLSVPALLPPTLWDSVSYHLAYAVDWAHAGRIYVDRFLRFPYYANNFLLIFSLMFVVKLGQLSHFVSWLCGLLTALGIFSLLSQPANSIADDRWPRFRAVLRSVVLPLTLALSAVFLRYLDTGYVDVPIGLFFLVPLLCTYFLLSGKRRNYEVDLIITAAFCVGMKISFFLYLPLFLLSLLLVLRRQKRKVSHTVALCCLLVALSAPWYLRNLIAVRDPIPPVFNLMLRGRDPIFTRTDYENLKLDLQTHQSLSDLALLPVKFFAQTDTPTFRDYGVNLSVTLLYLPLITLLLLSLKRFRNLAGPGFIYLNLALLYLLIGWLAISTYARYFLCLFPVFISYLGLVFNIADNYLTELSTRRRLPALLAQASMLLAILLLPYATPGAKRFYDDKWQGDYLELSQRLSNNNSYFKRVLRGYVTSQMIIERLQADGFKDKRVLSIGFENLAFYFRNRNTVNIGDIAGPGRTSDLVSAIDGAAVPDYLTRFNIGAVIINPSDKRMSEAQYQEFVRQLELNQFVLQTRVEPRTIAYLKAK